MDIELRDFLAGQALEGLVHYASASKGRAQDYFSLDPDAETWHMRTAKEAYRIADAMLRVREMNLPSLEEIREAQRQWEREEFERREAAGRAIITRLEKTAA